MSKKKQLTYNGFEQGPIRPPSEASSLLIRITRNCPWNHCTFCPVYKGTKFSVRPIEHVLEDIDRVANHVNRIIDYAQNHPVTRETITHLFRQADFIDQNAFYAALNWFNNGMASVFLQDANSLIIKPSDLVVILKRLNEKLPKIQRITSYARYHTIARISQDDLNAIRAAGLNRIHIGMESGADEVLNWVKKGVTKQAHINAGLKVKQAKMELSEYVMPGLGGEKFSEIHALETADALNQINPDFIRFRSLAIPSNIPLKEMQDNGTFVPCTDVAIAQETYQTISHLKHIQSVITSDHILNLFEDVQGKLPDDQSKMLAIISKFLNLSKKDQMIFQVGRRMGIIRYLSHLSQSSLRNQVESICNQMQITPENVDLFIQQQIQRFI